MKIAYITFFGILLLCFTTSAQSIDIGKIDRFVSHIEDNDRGIGSVSVFKDGKEIYNRSFGQQRLANVQYNAETRYQIGSITKLITATLVFDLVERKKLSLDDKLSKYYPQLPNSEKITIRNMLEHSSGLRDFTMKNDSITWLINKVSEREIIEEIKKQGVSFQPGEKVAYSNSAYFLLTKIVEKLSKKNYAALVEEKIAKPLNLKHLSSVDKHTRNAFDSYAFDGAWKKVTDFEYTNIIGVGDIAATTRDLNTFLYNLFHYRIIKKESVELMKPVYARKEVFGRGMMVVPFYENIFFGHGGDTYGTHSVVGYNEKDSITFSVAINGERLPHNDFYIGILSGIYGRDYTFPVFTSLTLRSEDLDPFLGTYSAPDFPLKVAITKDGNVLRGQGTGQPSFVLECFEKNKFKFDPSKLELEFFPEKGTMMLKQGGMNIEMKKE